MGRVIGKQAGVVGKDHGHHHGHRAGGARDLCRGTTEQGRKKAHEYGAVKSGDRSGAGGHTHSQRQRQSHHRRRQAAVEIATQMVEM